MNKATAEALVADGRRLMAAGEFAAACPKFAASQRLEPNGGAGFELADCYERLGRTASAWAEFKSAASAARSAGSKEREQLAGLLERIVEQQGLTPGVHPGFGRMGRMG